MHIRLWHAPYNGISIWFASQNIKRCQIGVRHDNWTMWWAIFGFSGGLTLQSWPWQRHPGRPAR